MTRWLSTVRRELDVRPEPGPAAQSCQDCDRPFRVGGHSVITDTGESRVTCDPCYRWRSARGLEFDARNRLQLEREVA